MLITTKCKGLAVNNSFVEIIGFLGLTLFPWCDLSLPLTETLERTDQQLPPSLLKDKTMVSRWTWTTVLYPDNQPPYPSNDLVPSWCPGQWSQQCCGPPKLLGWRRISHQGSQGHNALEGMQTFVSNSMYTRYKLRLKSRTWVCTNQNHTASSQSVDVPSIQ